MSCALSPSRPLVLIRSFLAASVLQVPRILDALRASPARGRDALFVRGEAAVRAIVGEVVGAPGPVNFGGSRACVDGGTSRNGQQGKSSADHRYPPMLAHRSSARSVILLARRQDLHKRRASRGGLLRACRRETGTSRCLDPWRSCSRTRSKVRSYSALFHVMACNRRTHG